MVMDNSVGRLQSLFPSHQFDVIMGSLLGDGRLECRSKGIRGPQTARFRVHHGIKQSDYVFWKYNELKDMTSTSPREITRYDKKRDINEISYYFHTRSTPELGIIHAWLYKKGRKNIPKDLQQIITPRMLAVWYMDDGSLTGNSCTLNTHSFDVREQEFLSSMLVSMFGIKASLTKDRDKYKLYIGANDFGNFIKIIRPYVIQSMNYKIVYPRNDLSALGQTELQHNEVSML